MKKIIQFFYSLVVVLVLSGAASACSVCFGNADSNQTIGLKWGMIAMLGFLTFMLGSVAAFMINFNLRLKKLKAQGI